MSKIRNIGGCFFFITLLNVVIFFWSKYFFGEPSVEQIIYHLKTSVTGTSTTTILSAIIAVIIIIVLFMIVVKFYNKYVYSRLEKKHSFKFVNVSILIFSFMLMLFSIYFLVKFYGLDSYIKSNVETSTFIENNYVNPKSVNVTLPKKKNNLIVLYVESLESNMTSKKFGGQFDNNYIPYLTKLFNENDSFSDNELMGGPYQVTGTSWSTAGYVSTLAGMPIKSQFFGNSINDHPYKYSNAVTLGDMLENDYNEAVIMGTTAKFGGIYEFFTNHGSYKIYDHDYFKSNNLVHSSDSNSWGINDKKLFELSKEKIVELEKSEKPYYINMITIDTHAPNGLWNNKCDKKYATDYENMIYCTDKTIEDFIDWLKDKKYYDDTTIVILGDHLSLNTSLMGENNYYYRHIYNVILNSKIKTDNERYHNRVFTQFDYFPTILASIGATIDGERLGLGTNLFSNIQTLPEQYSLYNFDTELGKRSKFYEKELLY